MKLDRESKYVIVSQLVFAYPCSAFGYTNLAVLVLDSGRSKFGKLCFFLFPAYLIHSSCFRHFFQ